MTRIDATSAEWNAAGIRQMGEFPLDNVWATPESGVTYCWQDETAWALIRAEDPSEFDRLQAALRDRMATAAT